MAARAARFARRGGCVLHLCGRSRSGGAQGNRPQEARGGLRRRRTASARCIAAAWISTSTRGASRVRRLPHGRAMCSPMWPDEVAIYRLWCSILSVARADGDDPESGLGAARRDVREEPALPERPPFRRLTVPFVERNGFHRRPSPIAISGRVANARRPRGIRSSRTSPRRRSSPRPIACAPTALYTLRCHSSITATRLRDFWLRFEAGRVVEYGARVGEGTLKSILETDEGGKRLGEVRAHLQEYADPRKVRRSSSTRSTTRTRAAIWRSELASRSATTGAMK